MRRGYQITSSSAVSVTSSQALKSLQLRKAFLALSAFCWATALLSSEKTFILCWEDLGRRRAAADPQWVEASWEVKGQAVAKVLQDPDQG